MSFLQGSGGTFSRQLVWSIQVWCVRMWGLDQLCQPLELNICNPITFLHTVSDAFVSSRGSLNNPPVNRENQQSNVPTNSQVVNGGGNCPKRAGTVLLGRPGEAVSKTRQDLRKTKLEMQATDVVVA